MGRIREDGAPPYWRTAHARAAQQQHKQQQRLARKLAGTCSMCGLPPLSGRRLCAWCAFGNRERQHKHYWRYR